MFNGRTHWHVKPACNWQTIHKFALGHLLHTMPIGNSRKYRSLQLTNLSRRKSNASFSNIIRIHTRLNLQLLRYGITVVRKNHNRRWQTKSGSCNWTPAGFRTFEHMKSRFLSDWPSFHRTPTLKKQAGISITIGYRCYFHRWQAGQSSNNNFFNIIWLIRTTCCFHTK